MRRYFAAGGAFMLVLCSAASSIFGDPDAPDTLTRALHQALDDERHARAFYRAVMDVHGVAPPFSRIIEAEGRHEAALVAELERLGASVPEDRWAEHAFDVPPTLAEACDAAIVAEVRNAEIYDALIPTIEDAQIRSVFENLRAASLERHLPAFQRHGSGWTTVANADLTETQRAQKESAIAARDAMFATLFGELSMAMADNGAAGAIEVCSSRAPEIARETAEQRGVRIGRTSWKLRNPKNTPPVWAELLLDERPEKIVTTADRSGRLGVIAPIKLSSACVQCHGPRETLEAAVVEELDRRYPEDRATGFAAGDLRGWFWIEVPAPK